DVFVTLDFQLQQLVAFFQAVAELYLQALDHPVLGRRDFHAGLVGLQGQQALFGLDAIANLDEQFDDFAFAAANVRDTNQFAHFFAPQQSSGLGLLVSIPKRAIASATTVRSMSRSEEHTSELQSRENLVCRLLLEQKKTR